MTVIGARISPALWPALEKKIPNRLWLWFAYGLVCVALCVAFSIFFYYVYIGFLDKVLIRKAIKADASLVEDFANPGHIFTFAGATIVSAYQISKKLAHPTAISENAQKRKKSGNNQAKNSKPKSTNQQSNESTA